ncbi:hypothetical protein CTAM01_04684 [Colletotrichum tamarilloi]|uniref:Uncharacterized protein n=1 Tax=Colletotrichum tamarilloi TaxID=1209934 RepID=A0ABQ9RGU4_9PEZI|nr:uncharacterized protein CTAM01_04684 [Colletotrichum tamarilloi]KAK1503372.1 hypothetical protein CTAM01_04684 [Colletotrichum tamarilloi]
MPPLTPILVLDFDGTITTKDTIGTLAEIGLQFQQQRGVDLSSKWQQILLDYSKDHANHVSTYIPIADDRSSLKDELAFLRGLKEVEMLSVQRVESSGIFRGIGLEYLTLAGETCRKEGRVKLRDGFAELMNAAREKGWSVAVVSVNWSRSFIKGVLSDYSVDVVANEIELNGSISGPEVAGSSTRQASLMTCEDKLRALRTLAARRGVEDVGALVYFGDSTTDIECLLATRGVVISSNAESSLMKTLRRIGYQVPKVDNVQAPGGTAWASTFVEVLETTMCFYRATVYGCKHSELGKKVTVCKLQRDLLKYTESATSHTCIERRVHSMNCVRKAGVCDKCKRLDTLRDRTADAFKSLQNTLRKRNVVDDDSGGDGLRALETFEAVEVPKVEIDSDDDSTAAHEIFELIPTPRLDMTPDELDDEGATSSKGETSAASEVSETSETQGASESSRETVEAIDTTKSIVEDEATGEPQGSST